MSDERLESELRSVLREIAGSGAPASLRNRVAAVTARAPARWVWFSPPLRLATAAVAVVAVLALAFIFIPHENVGPLPSTSQSPGKPTPSAVASPTATQAPSVTPTPGSPVPTPAPGAPTYDTNDPFAAIVLVNDLRVRETPGTGVVLGKVNAGDTVVVHVSRTVDGMTWYQVTADGQLIGWVAGGPDDAPWLDLKYHVAQRIPPRVEGIVGGAGFVAWGRVERIGWSDDGGRWVATSDDGREWKLGTLPDEAQKADHVLVAHGPAGWFMVALLRTWDEQNVLTASMYSFRSVDGLTWNEISLPADIASESTMQTAGLTGSASGYVLQGYLNCYLGDNCGPIFASRDLATWTRLDSPPMSSSVMTVGDGFLIRYDSPDVAISRYTDLVHAVDVAEGGHDGAWLGPWPGVPRAGDRLVTISLVGDVPDREVLTARIPDWNAPAPALSWTSLPAAAATFDSSTIAEMLTVGDEALVLGNSYASGALRAWRTVDGTTWHVIDTAALGDYAVLEPVASDGDVLVAVASEATAAGWSPRFARWTATEGWSIEQRPVLGTTEHAVVGACPEPPDTALEWGAIPGAVGAECFGDEPLSFVAWQPGESVGDGGSTWITEPRWLLDTFEVGIVEANRVVGIAVRSPHATGDWARGTWALLTGHWADAEASACRYRPDPMFPYHSLGGPTGNCGATFVLTEIARAP